jgi:hypothetical protein
MSLSERSTICVEITVVCMELAITIGVFAAQLGFGVASTSLEPIVGDRRPKLSGSGAVGVAGPDLHGCPLHHHLLITAISLALTSIHIPSIHAA